MENETVMTLSPAAEAVLDAWVDQVYDQSGTNAQGLAAALRAAADQVVPYEATAPWDKLKCDYDGDHWEMRQWVRVELLSIAAELEGSHRNGNDVHARTARLLLEKDEVSADERRQAQIFNFAALYGMGAQPEGTDG